eukprot:scaffold2901_cov98-Alexandrium_tamarense.AAC.2
MYPMGVPCTPRKVPFVMVVVNTLRSAAKVSYFSFRISESAGREQQVSISLIESALPGTHGPLDACCKAAGLRCREIDSQPP